ncbi:LysM peptidoglycan-binding domain-containing protein [Desulfogranum mediterraneum]|uniref:LysM peptidoglycan-binding domain-containing protein n=1 Tax=Desulfogranum mediterraneum TaxID=160661 RepID=UPI0012948409|nr:LysM peptidoglycan-binding domain-containing protein [Desulfogranum mediterraneum]
MPPDTAEQALPLAEPLTEPQAAYYTHTIRWPGENLIRIARWYTGSGKNWIRIVEANPTVDHRRLEIGEPILIPMELIKNREPMPAAYRMPVSPQKKEPSPAPSPQTSPKIVEDELFGPIDSQSESNAPKRKDIPPALETIE